MQAQVTKTRAYCVTVNNYTDDDIEALQALPTQYTIIGKERGAEGTPHLQVYLNYKSAVSFKALKKALPKAHIEAAKGSPTQNRNYCIKEVEPPNNVFYESGTLPVQGKRKDIDAVRETLMDTGKMRDVVLVANSLQSLNIASAILTYHETKRDWFPTVRWFYGATGAGKSRAARAEYPDAYYCGDTSKWWQGYDAHEDVVIDDFRKDWIKFHDLLRLLDCYPYTVENKGGSRQLLARNIIITSPFHPSKVYEGREDIQQLIRRITEIKEFTISN